jgi:hypothetical protein
MNVLTNAIAKIKVSTWGPCSKGVKCPNAKCGFKHAESWNPRSNVQCKEDLQCPNAKCGFKHTEGWKVEKKAPPLRSNVQCKADLQCPNAKCGFKHTEGWKVEKKAPRLCSKGAKCKKEDCTFGHPDKAPE